MFEPENEEHGPLAQYNCVHHFDILDYLLHVFSFQLLNKCIVQSNVNQNKCTGIHYRHEYNLLYTLPCNSYTGHVYTDTPLTCLMHPHA